MKKILLLLLIASFNITTNAQGSFEFHIGPNFPLEDFGDDNTHNYKALGANIGLGAGLRYLYPINDNGLGLFIGADVNFHTMKSDVEEEIAQQFSYYLEINEDDITFPNYISIPVYSGIDYTYEVDDKLSIFGNFGLALNFFKVTDFTIDLYNGEIITTYDMATKLGLKIGGGILLNDKTYIQINYFGLGKHKIKSTAETSGELDYNKKSLSFKSKINMVSLSIGFKL